MKEYRRYLAHLLGLHGPTEAEPSVQTAIDVRSVVDTAGWETAERILNIHAVVLRRKYPFLSERDVARLIQKVMVKLRSEEGARKLSVAGSPAGYLGVVLGNAAANLAVQRSSAFLSENVGLLNAEERRLFAMAFLQRKTIGEIASEIGQPYGTVAAQFFRMLRRMREDRAFRIPPHLEVIENKEVL